MNPVDWSNFIYIYFCMGTAMLYGMWKALHHMMTTVINTALEPICDDLTKIKYQVYNNGGESMKDAIDRIERDAIELKINQAIIKAKMEA
jgi:hypothetical protein